MLYMFEIVLVFRYFSHFSRGGNRYFHVLVCVMLVADTVGTVAVCSNAWLVSFVFNFIPATQLVNSNLHNKWLESHNT